MMNTPQALIGQQIDHYRILQHLARGGMADVFLAEDVNLGRKVAFKVMLDVLAQDSQFVQRFRREAQIVAQLDHPNIVQVYSTGLTPLGQPYIAMQYIPGGSLRDSLKELTERGKLLPTVDALAITRQLAVALQAAHAAGVVHRDLKPSNVLVRPDGTPVLVDMGIAAIRGSAKLTHTGSLIGTPHYMSPEQATGKPLDGRSDLYSLGVILYELLAGIRPFEATDSIAILHKHVYEAPTPLSQLRQDLSPATYDVVETSLQKDPYARFQTAANLVAALDHALAAEGMRGPAPAATQLLTHLGDSQLISRQRVVKVPLQPAQPPRKMNPLWLVTAVFAILLVATAAFILLRSNGTSTTPQATAQPTQAIAAIASNTPALPTSTFAPTATTIPTATETPTVAVTATPEPTAAPTELPATLIGPDGITMHLVPAGDFLMGSNATQVQDAVNLCRLNPDGEACRESDYVSELPHRTIYLSAFYMDETEVTNRQYRICVAAGGCNNPLDGNGRYSADNYYNLPEFANYPVVWVSWFDARDYCTWAGKRLPTEAEWEKAARGTDGRIFPWGNTFDSSLANTQERGGEDLQPVGQYPTGASPYGILDLAGSVWEYIGDWFDPAYYTYGPTADPIGPDSSPTGERAIRSGSYANFQHYARAANRGSVEPGSATQFRGIRCVITP